MFDIGVAAAVFGLVFVGELPDKTAVAGLVLGTKFPWLWAFSGIAAAFVTHVVVAVSAGSLIGLLPRRPVEAVVAALFTLGAFLIWREGNEHGDEQADEPSDGHSVVGAQDGGEPAGTGPGAAAGGLTTVSRTGFWRVAALGYSVIFIAEWGDLTQILTANLAAKYHSPLSVGVGAVLGLWAVGLLAIAGGKTLLRVLPMKWITRAAAVVMLGLAVYSLLNAITG